MHKIKGVFSAALTPINIDYSINSQLFLSHCEWPLSQGVDGLAVFGTTGEANTFNVDEKINSIEYLINAKINMIIQVDGKTRDVLVVNKDIEQHVLEELIKSSSKANKHIENKKIIKTIYIKNKIINYLIKN